MVGYCHVSYLPLQKITIKVFKKTKIKQKWTENLVAAITMRPGANQGAAIQGLGALLYFDFILIYSLVFVDEFNVSLLEFNYIMPSYFVLIYLDLSDLCMERTIELEIKLFYWKKKGITIFWRRIILEKKKGGNKIHDRWQFVFWVEDRWHYLTNTCFGSLGRVWEKIQSRFLRHERPIKNKNSWEQITMDGIMLK